MLAIVGIGFSAVALLLNIVGLAIPDWSVFEDNKTGLWKVCIQGVCIDIPTEGLNASMQATRAMEVLGTLVLTAALVCAILKQFVMKDQKMLPKISGAAAIASGVFMIIGAVIYAVKINGELPSGFDLNAGFALCVVAGVLAIVAAILILLGFKDE